MQSSINPIHFIIITHLNGAMYESSLTFLPPSQTEYLPVCARFVKGKFNPINNFLSHFTGSSITLFFFIYSLDWPLRKILSIVLKS